MYDFDIVYFSTYIFAMGSGYFRGVPRNLKRGATVKSRSFSSHSQVKSKKKVQHVRRYPIFRPKSSEQQKKVITPSDCPLYVYHFYTTKVLCICLRGEAATPLDTPLYLYWPVQISAWFLLLSLRALYRFYESVTK